MFNIKRCDISGARKTPSSNPVQQAIQRKNDQQCRLLQHRHFQHNDDSSVQIFLFAVAEYLAAELTSSAISLNISPELSLRVREQNYSVHPLVHNFSFLPF